MPVDAGIRLAQVLNGVTLIIVLVVAVAVPLLVMRDGRRRGLTWLQAAGWGLVSLALLPLGLGLYLLLGRRQREEHEDQA